MNEIYLSLKTAGAIGLIVSVIAAIVILTIHYALKYSELKKQSKTDSNIISKNMIRIVDQGIEIEMLKDDLKIACKSTKRKKLRKEIARLKRLNSGYESTITNMDSERLKLIEEFTNENEQLKFKVKDYEEDLKIANEQLLELNVLQSKNKALNSDIETMSRYVIYWKERALHQKHTKQVKPVKTEVESEYYECLTNYGNTEQLFTKGKIYNKSYTRTVNSNTLFLIGNNEVGYMVYKKDFKAVQK